MNPQNPFLCFSQSSGTLSSKKLKSTHHYLKTISSLLSKNETLDINTYFIQSQKMCFEHFILPEIMMLHLINLRALCHDNWQWLPPFLNGA